ncbi:TolC family protein [Bdellovibrionota bacterium]
MIEEIKLRRIQAKQAKEAYDIAKEQYQNGMRSTVELTEAQQIHTQARFQLVQAKYHYLVSKIRLDASVGRANWKST